MYEVGRRANNHNMLFPSGSPMNVGVFVGTCQLVGLLGGALYIAGGGCLVLVGASL